MGCLFKKPSGIYYVVFTQKGKRAWRSTFTKDPEEARRAYDIISREFMSWDRLTLSGFGRQLIPLLEGSLSHPTILLYEQAIRKFTEVIRDRLLRSVTPFHIQLYLTKRVKEVSLTKVNIDFRTLKAAFNRALTYKMIDENPFLACKNVHIPQQEPYFLSPHEFERLLQVADDPTLRAIIIMAVCTAMRLGELVNLRWNSIDFDRGLIHLANREDFMLKGRRNRTIPLNQKARGVLLSLPRTTDHVFAGPKGLPLSARYVSHQFKKWVRKAGLSEEVHFHTLRHTGASWLVQNNVPLSYIKEILGHSSITTTMIYSHSNPDQLRNSLFTIDSLFNN